MIFLFGVWAKLKLVPRWVWGVLATAVVILVLVLWHGSLVSRMRDEAYNAGVEASNKAWQLRFNAMRDAAAEWRTKAEASGSSISQKIGEAHAQAVRNIHSDVDALRVRGPGEAAACRRQVDRPGVPSSASGNGPPAGGTDAALASVPADQALATVPWDELVRRAGECDVQRSENVTWRSWFAQESALNAAYRRNPVQ